MKRLLLYFIVLNILGSSLLAQESKVILPFIKKEDGSVAKRINSDIYGESINSLSSSEKAILLMQSLFSGPSEIELKEGYLSPISSKTKLIKSGINKNVLELYISKEFLEGVNSPDQVIEYMEIAVSKVLTLNLPDEQQPVSIKYWIEGSDGIFHPDTAYTIPGKEKLPQHSPKYQPFSPVESAKSQSPLAPVIGRVPSTRPTGLLSGKRIGINAGHGWWYGSSWGVQREVMITGHVEDFNDWQLGILYAARYLWNAGADVFPSREWDMNTTELIFNNDNSSPEYTETSTISNEWATSSSNGYGGTYRFNSASGSSTTATATWRVIVPRADYYGVYEYCRPGNNRINDAQFTINHSGGASVVYMNQRTHLVPTGFSITSTDSRWYYMGNYYFDIGTTTITLSNFSKDTIGSVVIADAVRLGGGMAQLIPITQSGSTTIKPQWQAAAEYWTKYAGAPASVYNWGSASTDDGGNDWYSRPRHTIWEDCDAYLMIHANSVGNSTNTTGTSSGTRTYIRPDNTSAFMYVFATVVNYQIKTDVRAYWDATWSATTTAGINYAELGYVENAGIPGALFEVAYYDNAKDGAYLVNQRFEDILGRAFYKGVVRYFYSNPTIAPLPPVNLNVTNVGDGTIRLSWSPQNDPIEPTAVPSSYRVYLSTNGKGFDNGVYTSSTSYIYSGLNPNKVYYFQVSAVNNGGESMPTETLAVRVKLSGGAPILVVYAFDRIDTSVGFNRSDPYNPKVNQTFDYIIQHAKAIDAYGSWFDSADHKAVSNGLVNLNGYQAVVWVSGQQSTSDETFSSTEQSIMSTYLANGGNLFVSGSEIAWDLGRTSGSSDSTFLANFLKTNYVGDDAGTYNLNTGLGIFNGVSALGFDNGSGGSGTGVGVTYNVAYPDQLSPVNGSSAVLTYNGGLGGNAAIQYNGSFKVVYLGFPFETITSTTIQNSIMSDALSYFGITNNVKDWMMY